MLRVTLGSPICPACQTSGSAAWRAALHDQQQQILRSNLISLPLRQRRLFSIYGPDQAGGPKTRPARMVLSQRSAVASNRNDRAGSSRPSRMEGPFGGMNRTVANIDPEKRKKHLAIIDAANAKDRPNLRPDGREREPLPTFKALRMQRALATIGYGHRNRIKQKMKDIDSFDQFDLLPVVKRAIQQDALRGMIDIKPTPIQRLAIPELLNEQARGGRRKWKPDALEAKLTGAAADAAAETKPRDPVRWEYLLAAETGSGKTLAYLIPAINAVKKAEAEDPEIAAFNKRMAAEEARLEAELESGKKPGARSQQRREPHPTMARPKVIVLVPTAELVSQVGRVAKSLAHEVKCRVRLISAKMSPTTIEASLFSPSGLDVLVATPHLLSSIVESQPNLLSRVSHLVVDEADSLLDRSFSPVTHQILDRALPSLRQLVFCSATIPRGVDAFLANRFPSLRRITTPNLHAIPRRVQLGVIDVSRDPYRNNKNLACADAIWSIGKDGARHETREEAAELRCIMVFVNEREKAEELAAYLASKGIDAVALHRDAADSRDGDLLAAFTTSSRPTVADADADGSGSSSNTPTPGLGAGTATTGRRLPNTKVIVATDIASRGIDTLAVRHVVLYDVPHTTIDFIHRLGRAGRMGRRGRGVVLVGKDDRRDVVAEVKESMFMGQALI